MVKKIKAELQEMAVPKQELGNDVKALKIKIDKDSMQC
jgi:hypothetical protein